VSGGRRLALSAPGARIELDLDLGGRAVSWRVGDSELLAARGPGPVEHGMYPMAPWPGRLRGNRVVLDGVAHPLPPTFQGWAIHGTVLAAPMSVTAFESDATGARAVLEAPLGPAWPRAGLVRQVWDLRAGVLHTLLSVESRAGRFPAEVGWHPWFRRRLDRGGDLVVDLPATGVLERGPDHLPTGLVRDPAEVTGPYDDAFVVPDGRAVLTWPGALRLDVDADVGWYVLFDQLPDLVCVEPQSGPPDGLGTGAFVVSPGTPRTATAAWRWSSA
jgi:aldose 1-epimerase